MYFWLILRGLHTLFSPDCVQERQLCFDSCLVFFIPSKSYFEVTNSQVKYFINNFDRVACPESISVPHKSMHHENMPILF